MKAVVLTAYGDVDKLEVQDLPVPPVGANEIMVRMAGAGLNPIDWKLRSGALKAVMPLDLPAILGRDVSGEVVQVGPGVTRFKVGARVMGLVMGGYAELVVAGTEAWATVPNELDLIEAAALPLVLLTGAQLIETAVQPRRGDFVLVTGALGSVGRVAVFAAKARQAKVWAGVRGTQVAEAAALGADGIVALDDDADLEALPFFDGIADTVGGPAIERLFARLMPGGTIGSVVGEPAGAKERGLVVRTMLAHPDADRLAALAQKVADGSLVVPISKMFPLSQAREAQQHGEHHPGGKVILLGSPRVAAAARVAPAHVAPRAH